MQEDKDRLLCREGHAYTSLGLALMTNVAAVNALWRAIRALEDDAAGLDWLAGRRSADGRSAHAQREEASAARDAAGTLRSCARQAQARLDALPSAPSAFAEDPAAGQSRRPVRRVEG